MNATALAIEKGYPERQVLPDELVSWHVSIPDNVPYGTTIVNTSDVHGTVLEKLARKGFDVPSIEAVQDLARMAFVDVVTHHGREFAESLSEIRYPLGRTGLNGVGIFYEAGPSQTSDLITVYDDDTEYWTPLVFNRGRWNTPGGFREDSDTDGLMTAVRENAEEIGHQVDPNAAVLVAHTINTTSARITDHAWIEAEVYATQADSRFTLRAGDDAEQAAWTQLSALPEMVATKQLSGSKLQYIYDALTVLELPQR